MSALDRARAALPKGLVVRPPDLSDAAEVAEITNRQAIHDTGLADTSTERILTWWQEPTRDLARDSLVVTTDDSRVVAAIDYSEYDPYDENEFDLAVDPQWRGRGIEDVLLDWVEERAKESVDKAPAGAAVTLETRLWAANTADQAWLQDRGYQTIRYWDRMEIELDAAPVPPEPPDGVSIRTASIAEIDDIHAAWEDAQRDEFGFVSLTDEQFRYYFVTAEPDFDPSLWFLAIDDASGAIVGYVLGRWERPGDPACGQLRYVGVRRAWRRRGLASALLLRAFAVYVERGKCRVGLGVDSASPTGAHRLYERVGMRPVQRAVAFARTHRPAGGACRSSGNGLH